MIDREKAQRIADALGVYLSPTADEIFEKISERNGDCPCRIDGTKCTCKWMKEDLENKGQCHCGLFTKLQGL